MGGLKATGLSGFGPQADTGIGGTVDNCDLLIAVTVDDDSGDFVRSDFFFLGATDKICNKFDAF